MAEGDASKSKKIKLDKDFITEENKSLVLKALNSLRTSYAKSLCLLKIIQCDANFCNGFSDAKCYVTRSTENKNELYGFASIFLRGVEVLEGFLANPNVMPESPGERKALQRLLTFLQRKEDAEKSLGVKLKPDNKTFWTVRLAHHLLKELAVDQRYVIDDDSKNQISFCPCCKENITGEYGDNSMGSAEFWHGCVNLLVGPVAMKIATKPDPEERASSLSSFEIEDNPDLINERHQIISETIVFASIQKILNPLYNNFLIPTVGLSKMDILFFFYDAEHDILLESAPFGLFKDNCKELQYPTIIALWLSMNYLYFCTGITTPMKDRNHTAGFFSQLNPEVKDVYEKQLRFGNCRNRTKIETYHQPSDGDNLILREGLPVKKNKKD